MVREWLAAEAAGAQAGLADAGGGDRAAGVLAALDDDRLAGLEVLDRDRGADRNLGPRRRRHRDDVARGRLYVDGPAVDQLDRADRGVAPAERPTSPPAETGSRPGRRARGRARAGGGEPAERASQVAGAGTPVVLA